MFKLVDRTKFNTSTQGTGDIAIGSASSSAFYLPSEVGLADGDTVRYIIVDGTDVEEGIGTIADSVATMQRTTVTASKVGGVAGTSRLSLSGLGVVSLTASGADILVPANNLEDVADADEARGNLGISTEIGKIEWWPTTRVPAGRLKANGQSVSRSTYADLSACLIASGTATFTNGSENVGMVGHDLSVGDPIKLFTTGSLPTNFTAGTHGLPTVGANYFVKSVVDANTVTLSATVGGTAISAGSAGSGTHSWVNAPYGDGDGSTTFTLPDLRGNFVRGWNDDAAVDANRTIGDVQLDALQGHIHDVTDNENYLYVRGSAGILSGASGSDWDRQTLTIGSPVTDGTNGTPRTAAETRPRNVSLMVTIRYAA